MLRPVADQDIGIGVELGRLSYPQPVQLGAGLRCVEHRPKGAVGDDRRRDAEPGGEHLGGAHRARQLGQALNQPEGRRQQLAGQADRNPGRTGRLGQRVVDVEQRLRPRVHEMEGPAVQSRRVDQGIHCVDDVIDRHDVGVAEVRQHQRQQPGSRQVAKALEDRQEVVRTIDLVDLAGAAVTDDDGRTVDPPRHVGLPDQPFAVVLRLVVSAR